MSDNARSTKDRRRHARRKPRGRIRVTCQALPSGTNVARALLDLSFWGVRLLVKEALPLGIGVIIDMQRVNHMGPVRRAGTVQFLVEREDGSCIVGIELREPLDRISFSRLTE